VVPAAPFTIVAFMNGGNDLHSRARSGGEARRKALSIRVEALAVCSSQESSACEARLREAEEMDPQGKPAKPILKPRTSIDARKRTADPSAEPYRRLKPGLWRAARTITEDGDRVLSLHLDGLLSSVERLAVVGGRDRWRQKRRLMGLEDAIDRVRRRV
jgi:hypothetical protein